MPAPTPHKTPTDQRKRDTVRIHVLRAQVGLSVDEYRDLLGNLFDGKRSSTELDAAQQQRLINHLEGLQRRYAKSRPALPPLTLRQKKMFSLWQQLADKNLVRERGMAALKAWAKRQSHVDRWEWLNSHQEDTLIESLKRWLKRGNEAPHG